MRPFYALVATLGLVLLAAPASSAASLPGSGQDCAPDPCGTINTVCQKAFHTSCVGATAETAASPSAPVQCVGLPCDVVNAVCYVATKHWCLG